MKKLRTRFMSACMAAMLAVTPALMLPGSAFAAALAQTTADKVNVRLKPDGNYLFRLPKGAVCEVTGTVKKGGTVWYKVNATDPETKRRHTGLYVNGGFLRMLSDTEAEQQTTTSQPASTTTTVTPGTAGRLTAGGVNFRKGPSLRSEPMRQLASGTIVEVLSAPSAGDADAWYHVRYEGREGYIMGKFLQVLNQTAVGSGYVRTTKDGVNLRIRPGDSSLEQIPQGTVLPVTGAVVKQGGYSWVPVQSKSGKSGYVRGDCVTESTSSGVSSGSTAGTDAPVTSTTQKGYVKTTIGALNVRATPNGANIIGRVEKKGTLLPYYGTQAAGGAVWYQVSTDVGNGYVNGKYVTAADKDSAAADTSSSSGASTVGSDETMTIYPVEKIDWFTGGIQDLIPKGSNFKIYDVYTGTVWWAHRWSGANHADIEPLTAADTAKLCKMYGVSKASQITEKTHWHRRPCLVTVGKRTFACALYGVPHGTQTITNNNFDGQCCLHFTNSRTHETNRIVSYTVEAIEYAFNHCPAGKK